jgi:hypothetical protein
MISVGFRCVCPAYAAAVAVITFLAVLVVTL